MSTPQPHTKLPKLADLYNPLTMPLALPKAHQKLDTAVDAADKHSG